MREGRGLQHDAEEKAKKWNEDNKTGGEEGVSARGREGPQ
jgi:hypothetical protein